jgi:hypothetical protein
MADLLGQSGRCERCGGCGSSERVSAVSKNAADCDSCHDLKEVVVGVVILSRGAKSKEFDLTGRLLT